MNDLLDSAVAAHGGLDRWNQVRSITFDASITGAFWHLKGQGDALRDVRLEVDTTRQRVTIELAGQDKRAVFEPHRVVVQRGDGTFIEARDDPERSFDGHQFETPWDDIHLAYFVGEAQWTYVNMPFLATRPRYDGMDQDERGITRGGGPFIAAWFKDPAGNLLEVLEER
jgi:hypothetical protein